MQKLALLKILQQLCLELITVKPDQRSPSKSNAGFTLIEVVVVMFMIGILGAIAVPSWITFTNQRQVNAANDAVLGALQEAQRQAKNKKQNYSVSFITDGTSQVPQIALYLDSASTVDINNSRKPLGADLQLKPEQIWMGTNLSGKNTAVNSVSVAPNTASITATTAKITFDYMGALPGMSANNNAPVLKVVVAVRPSGNSTQPSDLTKRCVIVQTLLGTMRTAKGTDNSGTACD